MLPQPSAARGGSLGDSGICRHAGEGAGPARATRRRCLGPKADVSGRASCPSALLAFVVLAWQLTLAQAPLPTGSELDDLNRCRENGNLVDLTASYSSLPLCVGACPADTVVVSGQCVRLAGYEDELQLGFVLSYHCGDDCPSEVADHETWARAVHLRMTQFFRAPSDELRGQLLRYSANGVSHPELQNLYIARRDELDVRRLSDGTVLDTQFFFLSSRLESRRLAADDPTVLTLLEFNASSLSAYLDFPVGIFNASLTMGSPLGEGLPNPGDYFTQYRFVGLDWNTNPFQAAPTGPCLEACHLHNETRNALGPSMCGLGAHCECSGARWCSEQGQCAGQPLECAALSSFSCYEVSTDALTTSGASASGSWAQLDQCAASCEGTHDCEAFLWNASAGQCATLTNAVPPTANLLSADESLWLCELSQAGVGSSSTSSSSSTSRTTTSSAAEDDAGGSSGGGSYTNVEVTALSDRDEQPMLMPLLTILIALGCVICAMLLCWLFRHAVNALKSDTAAQQHRATYGINEEWGHPAHVDAEDASCAPGKQYVHAGSTNAPAAAARAEPRGGKGQGGQADGAEGAAGQDTAAFGRSAFEGGDPSARASRFASGTREGSAPEPQVFGGRSEGAPHMGASHFPARPQPPSHTPLAQDAPAARRPSATAAHGADVAATAIPVVQDLASQLREIDITFDETMRTRMPLAQRKRLFHEQCRRWHPDKNPHDPETAKQIFQHLQDRKNEYLSGLYEFA